MTSHSSFPSLGTNGQSKVVRVLALLTAVAVWAAGVGAFLSLSDPGLQELASRVAFLGVFATTPLWLIFALRASRPRCLERLPLLPSLIALPPEFGGAHV